jgi:hypothetical protein
MKYVFRLSAAVKEKLDAVAPARAHRRSAFIREALVGFLCKPKQPLADRPHLRGREKAYRQICATLDQDQLDAIRTVYPEVSVSVVIQAAVSAELRKARYRMVSLPVSSQEAPDAIEQDTNANPNSRKRTREPKATRRKS